MPGFLLGPADDRLAGANDELFVVECDLGMFGREKVEVRFTDRFFGILEAEFFAQGLADFGKARLSVLEVNVVGDVVEQGAQQIAFVGERLLHFPAFGHVPEHALNADDIAQRIAQRRPQRWRDVRLKHRHPQPLSSDGRRRIATDNHG